MTCTGPSNSIRRLTGERPPLGCTARSVSPSFAQPGTPRSGPFPPRGFPYRTPDASTRSWPALAYFADRAWHSQFSWWCPPRRFYKRSPPLTFGWSRPTPHAAAELLPETCRCRRRLNLARRRAGGGMGCADDDRRPARALGAGRPSTAPTSVPATTFSIALRPGSGRLTPAFHNAAALDIAGGWVPVQIPRLGPRSLTDRARPALPIGFPARALLGAKSRP